MREVTVIIPDDRVGDLYEVIAGYYREEKQRAEGATSDSATQGPTAEPVTAPIEAEPEPTAQAAPPTEAAPAPESTPEPTQPQPSEAVEASEAKPAAAPRRERPAAPRKPAPAPESKYATLVEHLQSRGQDRREFTFNQIEKILGFPLPKSAKNHRAWWANSDNHAQARAWMAAGWRTEGLDLKGKKVSFVRADVTPAGAAPAQAATKGKTTAATSSQGAKAATRGGKRSTTRKRTKTQAAGDDASAGERYAALANLLRAGEPQVEFSFEELEEAGVDLPRSAFSQEDWWANSESNEQALTWISQGYRATDVDLDQGRVRFKRY